MTIPQSIRPVFFLRHFTRGRQWPYHGLTDRVFLNPVCDTVVWSLTFRVKNVFEKKEKKALSLRPWYGHWRIGSKTWLKKKWAGLLDSDMVTSKLMIFNFDSDIFFKKMRNYGVNWGNTMKYLKVAQDSIIFTGITCVNLIQFQWMYRYSLEWKFIIFNFDCDIFFEKMHNYVTDWWNTRKYTKVPQDWIIFTNFFYSNHCNMEWNNDLIEKCCLKRSERLIYELTFSIIAQTVDKIQRNYIFANVSIWFELSNTKHSPFDYLSIRCTAK